MKIFTVILLIYLSITFANKVAFALEEKPVMNLELAKKMADACEAKKSTTDWRPLTLKQRETLKDSIAYMIGRKLWYTGRRSAYETDAQFNRRTKHMRPAMGTYSAQDKWKAGEFPYDETYQYTSGELPELEEKLKKGETVRW